MTRVRYSCGAVYRLSGSNVRTCTQSGQWSGEAPYCIAASLCPILSAPRSGYVNFDSWINPSKAVFSCDKGYDLGGSRESTCLSTARWSRTAPTCDKDDYYCPQLSSPAGGRVRVPSRGVYSTATYSCYTGKSLVGNSRRTCLSNGTWSGRKPSCVGMSTVLTTTMKVLNNYMYILGTEGSGGSSSSTSRYVGKPLCLIKATYEKLISVAFTC